VVAGPRKHQGLAVERRRSYFEFDLDTEVEPIRGMIHAPLRAGAVLHHDALPRGRHPERGQPASQCRRVACLHSRGAVRNTFGGTGGFAQRDRYGRLQWRPSHGLAGGNSGAHHVHHELLARGEPSQRRRHPLERRRQDLDPVRATHRLRACHPRRERVVPVSVERPRPLVDDARQPSASGGAFAGDPAPPACPVAAALAARV